MSDQFTIMFVCTGNTCRSPMAEGALRHLLAKEGVDDVNVVSSGTGAANGFPATLYAIEAAKTWEIDISHHQSQPLTKELIEKADMIFAMTPGHLRDIRSIHKEAYEKSFLFKNYPDNNDSGEGVADPIGMSLEEYNKTFLEIGEYLGKHLPQIIKQIEEKKNA